jgi:acetylornithine deacetylase/succinyl-diaminopimelate desuccinylase-like protein
MLSGYTAAGTKTVLPSWAMAKISCRLVPDQDPEEVHQQMRAYLEKHAPPTVSWNLHFYGGNPAAPRPPFTGRQALSKSMQTVWESTFIQAGRRLGAGGAALPEHPGVESVNTGFAMPGDNLQPE